MIFRRNKSQVRGFSKKVVTGVSLFMMLACMLMLPLTASASGPMERATVILERWTSFHWGRDCLVWIVHYPDELIGPWVEAEAGRRGLSEKEKEEYRRTFISSLRVGDTESFLLTIYQFGSSPLNLSPLSEKLFMVDSSEERILPLSYEKKFDQPIYGIVQGLIFFPKQEDAGFHLVIKGLGVYDEQKFSFTGDEADSVVLGGRNGARGEQKTKTLIVDLPSLPKEEADRDKEGAESHVDGNSSSTAESSERERLESLPVERVPMPEPVRRRPQRSTEKFIPISSDRDYLPEKAVSAELELDKKKQELLLAARSRTQVVEDFVKKWKEGDFSGMYALLSAEPRQNISFEDFAARAGRSPLRWALKDGYTIKWLDDGRAKVIAAQKLVLIRVLRSEILGVAREKEGWRVSW